MQLGESSSLSCSQAAARRICLHPLDKLPQKLLQQIMLYALDTRKLGGVHYLDSMERARLSLVNRRWHSAAASLISLTHGSKRSGWEKALCGLALSEISSKTGSTSTRFTVRQISIVARKRDESLALQVARLAGGPRVHSVSLQLHDFSRKLSFSDIDHWRILIAYLESCPNLRSLSLASVRPMDLRLVKLSDQARVSQSFKNLKALSIGTIGLGLVDLLARVGPLPNIQTLTLGSDHPADMSHETGKQLCLSLQHYFPNLLHLSIWNPPINLQQQLQGLSSLTSLHIGSCDMHAIGQNVQRGQDTLGNIFRGMTLLKELSVSGTGISICELKDISRLSSLQRLSIEMDVGGTDSHGQLHDTEDGGSQSVSLESVVGIVGHLIVRLGYWSDDDIPSGRAIQALLERCPQLKEVGIAVHPRDVEQVSKACRKLGLLCHIASL